ncbi:uncharacterized protein [Cicer arietinum]|uniref:Uncharacterized protein LOC101502273 n=1 Tax=Cicer arietinum TaxID=3827 RepID=A0A1S2XBI7_CICAR|nr:uncharacterized protein LOC101502273 [Cicer arietinum]
MATNSVKCTLVTIFIFAMALSPTLPSCDAARVPLAVNNGPICPTCVCCTPPPPGSCCKQCCASPIESQTIGQSP